MAERKRWSFAVVLALGMGCGQGTEGPEGPPGPAGPAGPAGSSSGTSGRLVWKDATGSLVANDLLVYQDAQKHLWYLDSEQTKPILQPVVLYYPQPACGGSAYVLASQAQVRFPLQLEGETSLRVRGDTVQSAAISAQSYKATAVAPCNAITTPVRGVLVSDLTTGVQAPTLGYAVPLHLERLP